MTTKRRADLQRKLSMSAMPQPPDDLAGRIKADIPQYLSVERERARFSRTVSLQIRVAASILFLVTSLLVTVHLLQKDELSLAKRNPSAVTMAAKRAERPVATSAELAQPAPSPAAPPARLDEFRAAEVPPRAQSVVQTAESGRTASAPAVAPAVAPAAAPAEPSFAPEPLQAANDAASNEALADEKPVQTADTARREETFAKTAAGAPAVSAPEAMSVPPPPEASAQMSARATPQSIVGSVYADHLALAPSRTLFGFSVDPSGFARVKSTLENGSRPAAANVDVEALVNYFAGSRNVRHGVHLEIEGSPAPVDARGERAILRFTIDTESVDVRQGASIPPVATDARLSVDIDPQAVATFHRIDRDQPVTAEATLLQNASVTGLYELTLRHGLKATQRVATVRLTYTSVADGQKHRLEEILHGSNFAHAWSFASRRHRLASLGAVWGESLKAATPSPAVAQRAEELATQNPGDSRARELADAVTASSRIRSGAPTGSW